MGLADNFSIVEKKPSAFKSNSVGHVLIGQKEVIYTSIEDLKQNVLKVLNDEFPEGENPHVMV